MAQGAQRFFFAWVQTWRLKARKRGGASLGGRPALADEFRGNQIVRHVDESTSHLTSPRATRCVGAGRRASRFVIQSLSVLSMLVGDRRRRERIRVPTRRDHPVDETVGNGVVGPS